MHTGPSLNRYAEKLRAHLKGVELPILLLVLLLGTGVWGFAEVADAVSEEVTQQIGETILLAMRTPGDLGDPYGPLWLEEVGRDVTALGGVAVLVQPLELKSKGRSTLSSSSSSTTATTRC